MGIILCETHGSQGFREVCVHIWNELAKKNFPIMRTLPGYNVKICNKCYQENNVGELQKITFDELLDLPDEEFIKFKEKYSPKYKNLDRRCKCIECIRQIELINTIKNGEDPSFEPFENTLMYKDTKIIEQLREVLTSHFEFPKSQNNYNKSVDAFFMRSGGVSYPFSIKFYYITEKKDQNKLLKLIDGFFETIPQKQRHISFYEFENWITEELEIGIRRYKGEEKLLLENMIK